MLHALYDNADNRIRLDPVEYFITPTTYANKQPNIEGWPKELKTPAEIAARGKRPRITSKESETKLRRTGGKKLSFAA